MTKTSNRLIRKIYYEIFSLIILIFLTSTYYKINLLNSIFTISYIIVVFYLIIKLSDIEKYRITKLSIISMLPIIYISTSMFYIITCISITTYWVIKIKNFNRYRRYVSEKNVVGDVQYQKNNAEIMTDVKKVLHNYETNNYLFTLYNLIKAQYKVNFFSKETSDEWEQRKHKSIKKNINKLQKNLLLNIISLGKYGNFKSVMYKLQDNIKEKETKSKCSYCGNVSSTKNMDFASKNKEGIHWKCKNGCNNSQTTYDKENIDYYKDILGIQGDITEEKIKQAYREKVKKKHPDQGGSMKEFMKIKDAYNSLLEKIV